MAGVGILTRMFGTAISGAAGFASGTALGPVMTPIVQLLRNDVNAQYPYVPPDPGTLAEGVATGQVDPEQAAKWAAMHGVGDNAFQALVDIANAGPALGYAYQAWRRGKLTDEQFKTALRRTGLERQWDDALEDLKGERLDVGAVATAVHRGIMVDAGLLVTGVPSGPTNVPRIPVSDLDTLKEFAAHGIDPERARVLVANTGLPLSLGQMLALLNRGKVTETDVQVSIAESNVRNEYMDVALELRRRLLTPHEYAESELRGVKSHTEAQAGAKLSGLEPDDYKTLFEIMGRPLNAHEITTAQARGGTFGGTYDDVPEPYRDAIRRSAIRPEYAVMAWHNRFTYPSAFVIRALAEAGDLGDTAAVAKLLEKVGWEPALAMQVAGKWAPKGAAADTHVAKARTQLWTATHSSYVKGEITTADATAALTTAGVDPVSIAAVLAVWDAERALIRKQLSVSQIQKAVKTGKMNPATGAVWTITDAEAALRERGYDQADAFTIIAEA